MPPIRTTIASLALLTFASVASAADEQTSKEFSVCMDKSGGVTIEMLNCIGSETKLQDARLNAAYKRATAQLSAPRKKQLLEAQRAWLKFRDANCGFYGDPDGGTSARVVSSDCFMSTTAERAKALEQIADDLLNR